uniref:Uncharacterized protein n=1 Tax=Arion vulgaris TaxID=1028688 RepID=A0A0B6Z009_9EUPU
MKEPVLLKNGKPNDILFSSGIGSTMYSYFRSRLENFLGTSESLSKIVLVSSITKGVAYGLRESSSDSVNLVASLATKFISDKYGNFLSRNGGMTKLVLEAS